jgi:hypothetical protein
MKKIFKRIVPNSLWGSGSNIYWGWHNRGRHLLAKVFNPRWNLNYRGLQNLHDRHKGQRCFIIGNGPSLRQTNLSLLKDEFTFGLNRIYLLFPTLGFTTTYLVSVNDMVLEQSYDEMRRLEIPKFITWRARCRVKSDPSTIFLDTDYTGPETFTGDASGRLFEGHTVTFVALQLAFYMGFQEVILVGVDHDFVTQGPANQAVISEGDDPNHFSPDYFGKGYKWQLPDLEGSERAYRLAKVAYEVSGRKIWDGTVGGKLNVFSKINYESFLK